MSTDTFIRSSSPHHVKFRPNTPVAALNTAPVIATALVLASVIPAGWAGALAADLPVKAPPAMPAYSWAGCYLGGNTGAGATGTDFTSAVGNGSYLAPADAATVTAGGNGSANATNWIAGGQAGCNWQSGTLVYGLEGDAAYLHGNPQFINGTGSLADGTAFTVTQSLTTNLFATLRPRLGVAADRNLFYVTGGVAFTQASYTQSYVDGEVPAGIGSASGSKSLTGWVAGAGWEYAWTDHWIFRLEYLFSKFPTTSAMGNHRCAWSRNQSAHRLRRPGHPDRPRRPELQILNGRAHRDDAGNIRAVVCAPASGFQLHRPPAFRAASGRVGAGQTQSRIHVDDHQIQPAARPKAAAHDASRSSRSWPRSSQRWHRSWPSPPRRPAPAPAAAACSMSAAACCRRKTTTAAASSSNTGTRTRTPTGSAIPKAPPR